MDGESSHEIPMLDGAASINKVRRGHLLQIQSEVENQTSVEANPMVHELLKEFEDEFQEPKELPPSRPQDHKIPLTEGVGPISR